MTESPDADLLRRYAADASEPAFAELVRRHVDLVYSAALRQTAGNHHWAQEVTQMVFTTLARKAGSLLRHPALPAWLYRTTAFTVAMSRRTAARRAAYEQRAAAEILSASAGVSPADGAINWSEVRPVLDAAMGELPERDREAIVLRYFINAPLADVGRRLGLSENAARMRVDRALDKLRLRLARHGVTSTTSAAALGMILSEQAVAAAPFGLAASATAGAIAMSTTASVGAAALIPFMTATKVSIAAWTLIAAAGAGFLVHQQRAEAHLAAQIASDRLKLSDEAGLRRENARLVHALTEARGLAENAGRLDGLRQTSAALNLALLKRTQSAHATVAAAKFAANGKLFDLRELDVQPMPTSQTHPQYPLEMRRAGRGGTVVVDFVVDQNGTVQNASAVSSTVHEFEGAAVAAVSQWAFKPGQVGGTSVAAHLQVPIVFSINNDESDSTEYSPNDWFGADHAH